MSSFKVGDKVRVIDTKILSGIPNGTTGVVLKVYTEHGDDYLAVKLEKYGTRRWYASRFQLAGNYKKRITTY